MDTVMAGYFSWIYSFYFGIKFGIVLYFKTARPLSFHLGLQSYQRREMQPLILLLTLLLLSLTTSFTFKELLPSLSVSTINTPSNYTFNFYRSQSPSFNGTPWNTEAVNTTDSVTVTFPAQYTITNTVTCLSITVDGVSVGTFGCSTSATTVTFTNPFAAMTGTSLFVQNIAVVIGNVINPKPATSIAGFTGTIGLDLSTSSTSAVQLTAGFFTSCSITFSPTTVSNPTSTMIVSITPTNQLTVTSTLIAQFPKSTWTNDISNQILPISTSMACTNHTPNIKTGISCVGSSNTIITVSNIFQSNINAPFAFGVNSFRSPPSNQPSDLITITSYQGSFQVDTCTVYPSGLVAASFQNFSLTPTTTMTVNSLVALKFNVTLAASINKNDYLRVVFPIGTTFIFSTGIFGTSVYTQPPTISGQTVEVYHSSAVTAGTLYTTSSVYILVIQQFQAPPSTIATPPIQFSVIRNGYAIMTGSASVTAVADTLSATVTPAVSRVKANTSYTFSIPLNHPLSSAGLISITLPAQVVLNTSASNCADITGIGMNQQPTCTFTADTILLANLNGSTSDIASQTIQITINGLTNPGDTSTSGSFPITTYYSSDQAGITQTGTSPGVTATVGSIAISTASVVPSSYLVLQSGVTYTVTFNNTYIIPQGGFISLSVPIDIIITMASLSTYTKFTLNGGTFVSAASSGTTNTSHYQINFTNIAQSAPIAANTRISLQIDTICKNPTNTRIVSPFAITTYSTTSAIETLSGITVQMVTPASFYVFNVARASDQNSVLTSYTFTLRQEASLPSGTLLFITFPSQISMTNTFTCTDLLTNNLTCTQTSPQDLIVTLPLTTANIQYGVIISNVQNPFSYRPSTGNFTAITKTSDQISIYSQTTFPSTLVNSLPSTFTTISYSFSPGAYGSSQSLTLTVTPSTNIAPTYFLVSLAPSLTPVALTCNSFVGFTGSCSLAPSTTSTLNVSGMTGTSQASFTISGFTSPTSAPSDSTTVSSFQNGFMVDQNTSFVKFTITCTLPCRTCQGGNFTACLSCYNNSTIAAQNLYYPAGITCVSTCPPAYFDNGALTCLGCATTCLSCLGLNSNCTSCNTISANPALNIVSNLGSCLSACPLFYYLSSTATPPQCTICDNSTYHCSTCTSLTSCSSCIANFYLYNSGCIPTCPSNFTIQNAGTWTCDSCSSQCATCMGTISNCTSCSSTSAFFNGQCVSSCPTPLVISGGSCVSCDNSCKVCSGITTNCTSCYTNSTLPYLTITTSFVGSCVNQCPQLYYGELVNGLCVLCSTLNIGCANCSSQTTCLSCDLGYVFYLNTCTLTVPLGYYNNSGIATVCNANCATCSLFATNCTSCIGVLALDGNTCTSTCPAGRVAASQVCVSCVSGSPNFCKTCFGTTTNCTSCSSVTPTVYLLNGVCSQTCPNYTFPNTSSLACQPCTIASHCQTCFSQISCHSCINGYFLYNDTCDISSACPTGTIPLDRLCIPCASPCLTCTGSITTCTSCVSTFFLYNTSTPSCLNPCPTPLFMDNNTQTCTGCSTSCTTCSLFSTTCTSCPSGQVLQSSTCQSSCSIGFYNIGSICTICPNNCASCISNLSCTACTNSHYLYINQCVVSCPLSRPIIDINGACSICTDTACMTCDGSNFCQACYYPYVLVQGSCQTSCPTDYILNSNGTACVYSPGSNTNSSTTAANTLTQSLTTSSNTFPVPFTIAAAFLAIACLMSKFQNPKTFLWGALYSLWGLLEWAAICFLVFYYYYLGGTTSKLSYLLLLGGLACLYFLNFIFILVQNLSIKGDRRLISWLAGTFNTCWYWLASIIGLFCTNKFKNILFSKLFSFGCFSARLQNILRSYNAFGFFAFLSSLAVLVGASMLLSQTPVAYNQLYMAIIDVLVLTILCLILALCHTRKPDDYFQDIDQDGLKINKRIQSFDQVLNQHILPSIGQQTNKSYLQNYESARKFNVGNVQSLSQIGSLRSYRDISIQAQQILGQRSMISRLGTQKLSDLSLFERNHDISIQFEQRKQMVDMSVGQEVMVKDVSISPASIEQHDVSIEQTVQNYNQVSVQYSNNNRQISIQMEPVEHQQVSIQMSPPVQEVSMQMTNAEQHNISIQLDPPVLEEVSVQMSHVDNQEVSVQMTNEAHSMSIQYVPMQVDETVHMSREEADLAIQCNAQNQEISIQYSAKPLIEMVDQNLQSMYSLNYTNKEEEEELDQPSDLDLQRRMLQGNVMPAQRGLKAELQIDINQKLYRKERELEGLQRERWEMEKDQARRKFQKKVFQKDSQQGQFQQARKNKKIQVMFGNQNSEEGPSSLMHTQEIIQINLPPRHQRPPTARTERDILNLMSGERSRVSQDISGDSRQKQEFKKRKVDIQQQGNIFLEQQPQMFDENQEQTFEQQQLDPNVMEMFPSAQKSRSTANMTANRRGQFMLQDSQDQGHHVKRQEESINMHPLEPNHRRSFREEEIDQHKKTNLNTFLSTRRGHLASANLPSRRPPVEEDDALNREMRQRPLAPQKSQKMLTQSKGRGRSSKQLIKDQFQFDNHDRVIIPDQLDLQQDALERETKKVLPRRSSQKRLPSRDVFIERQEGKKSGGKNYLRQTYTSAQKQKSLEKIYLNKLSKK